MRTRRRELSARGYSSIRLRTIRLTRRNFFLAGYGGNNGSRNGEMRRSLKRDIGPR